MDVTSKLLRVFMVEKQLRGLQSRLGGAEKFLSEQVGQLGQIDARRNTLDAQVKQHLAKAGDFESEVKRLDAKLETIKEQMNNAQTNKEYKAFLTEVNTFKTERDKADAAAKELLAKVEELRKSIAELNAQRDEREKMRQVASDDRAKREAEIRERLAELRAERERLASEVPADAMTVFLAVTKTKGEDAMGVIEIQDAKRHEFNCGVCMMSLPMEAVFGLMSSGRLTKCPSCSCILYMDEEASTAMAAASKRR